MLVGKYLQFALIGSALASFATAEESKLRKGGRKLGNRKNRGYTRPTPATSAPIDNSVPNPTVSPSDEPTFYPTLSPTLSPAADIENPTMNPTLSPTVNPTQSPVWKADGWKADGYPTLNPTLSPTLNPTFSPTLNPTLSPTLAPSWSPTLSPTELEPVSADPTKSPVWKADGWKADGYPTLNPTLSPTEASDPIPAPPTLSPTLSPTFSPSEYSCGDSWHRSTSALNPNSCTNDKEIPNDPSRLYDTVQECCKAEFGKVAGCQVYNVCGPRTPGPASNMARKPASRPTKRQK
ncbi:hypothetical protein ACHAWO_000884 [Cyclotella atomus]|uniref:Uncharacterized protein n=1 Tax=Cyclotella atomus TaxID=382360 RepID=A0ABD3PXC7_9STRA